MITEFLLGLWVVLGGLTMFAGLAAQEYSATGGFNRRRVLVCGILLGPAAFIVVFMAFLLKSEAFQDYVASPLVTRLSKWLAGPTQ